MDALRRLIDDRPAVLDGGLATELERRGHDLSGRLWSARLLAEDPRAVLAVHRDFAAVGADVLMTATYQASVDGFVRAGVAPSQAWRLIAGSVALARGGAEEAGRDEVLVAGSCGPLAATFGGAAEYRGYDGAVSRDRLRGFHLERARILLDAGVDVLAFETLPSLREVEAVVDVVERLRPAAAWISLTTADGHRTPEGDPLDRVPGLADGSGALLGVNCSDPGVVPDALAALGTDPDTPLVAYPNLGARWHEHAHRWVRVPDPPPLPVADWVGRGARVVGGCCGTTPDDVRGLHRRLGPAPPHG